MNFSRTTAALCLLLGSSSCFTSSSDERLKARAKRQRHEIRKVVGGKTRVIRCGASVESISPGDGLVCEVSLNAPIPAELGLELCSADVELQAIFEAVRSDLIEADWVRMWGCGIDAGGNKAGYSIQWFKKQGWVLSTRSWGQACSMN